MLVAPQRLNPVILKGRIMLVVADDDDDDVFDRKIRV